MKQKQVAIVHFNTPELTEACIYSIRKHGGEDYHITIFDNSDSRPFTMKMDGVTVIDNTKGQIIDFDKALAKYPKAKYGAINDYGSDKHMLSIQKLWELMPDGFVLMDSDVLLKANIDHLWQENQCAVGHVQNPQPGNNFHIGRLVPMLCYINVPLCKKHGLKYFDPKRAWMIHSDSVSDKLNWYDTGAAFYEDLHNHKNGARGRRIDIRPMMEHYKRGSWLNQGIKRQAEWLKQNRKLWEPTPQMRGIKKVAICAIGRNENRYAEEFVEHYKKIGVSKMFIYDNYFGDEEPLAKTLKKYVDSGFVEIIDIHDRKALQCRAYEHCYKNHGDEYAWIGFLDFDEYLRWEGNKKIEAMFQQYTNGDCVLVNWRLFTDNGLVHYDPRPLKERFTEVMPVDKHVKYDDREENTHVKCFIRGGLGEVHFDRNPHSPSFNDKIKCVNSENQPVRCGAFVSPFTHKVMRLDHYWTKTAEEWITNKLVRGFPSGRTYIDNFIKAQERYFFAVNERTPEKEAILRDGIQKVIENFENTVTSPQYEPAPKPEPKPEPEKVEVQNGDPSVVVPEEKPKQTGKPKTRKSTNRKGKKL